ncbi:putative disease resistance protein [Quercus suber]|uniref:Disease resistance protein n=1 Tax=Quercus suber TaxID=58331 RepID=A0AAW0KAD3_QUESU
MAAEVPVSLLWGKLQKMRDEERFVLPGLRNRVVTAVNELEKILCFLKASKSNHEIISISPQETSLQRTVSSSTPQEASLLRTIYSAEHFTESFLLQRRRKGVIQIEMPLAFSPWTQLWFSFKMMKLVQRVKAVSMQFGETQGQPMVDNTELPDRREIHAGQCCRRCHHLVGELVARLIYDNEASLCVISLVREEVNGEEICFTTLAREVYDRLDIQLHFRSRAWLKVPRDPEYKNLLLALLKQLPSCVMNDLEHMNEKELCTMLFQFLMEDRFLIVLDDVQTVDVWLKFVRPFADAVNGSRVILTTTNIDVAKQADPWSSPLELSPLIEQDPDAIFVGREDEVKKLLPTSELKDLDLMVEEELSDMLFKCSMEHRFLIVLDEVQVESVYKLFRCFGDAVNGSRVILTTRDFNIAKRADPWSSPLKLRPLTEGKSWSLFLKKVGRPEYSKELNNLREDILRICEGFPVAIVLLGGVLSALDYKEWSRVIGLAEQRIGSQSRLANIVDFGYDQLPYVLKPCFLYLALFPKAYEIPIRRLLQLWLAEGFVQFIPDRTIPEDEAKRYLEELVCRNMIEIAKWKSDGSPKTCRMPTYLYDIFLPKANDIGFLHVHHRKTDCASTDSPEPHIPRLAGKFGVESSTSKSHIRQLRSNVSSNSDSTEPYIPRLADKFGVESSTSKSHIRQLRSYVSFNSEKRDASNSGIGKFLKTMIKRRGFVLLKVLDLEGVYKPSLPKKLGKLQNLRYLGLRWTGLDTCPESVGYLPCLETLDLKYTNVTTLPSSIWKAKKLRHLYMNEIFVQKPPKESLPNLLTLMELHIGANCPYKYKLDKFTSLRKLGLTCHSKSAWETAKCISELVNLQTLKLKSRDPFGQPVELVLAPMKEHRTLSNLYLFGEIKKEVDIYICKEHRFLSNLHLSGEMGKEDDLSTNHNLLVKQNFLEDGIHNVPRNLRTLTLSMSGLEDDPMPVLGKLLPQLNTLRLFARSYVKSKMTCHSTHFPKLRVLKMWNLERLEQWEVEQGAMPQLVELEIRCCEKLNKSVKLEKLDSLEELILTNMPQDFKI